MKTTTMTSISMAIVAALAACAQTKPHSAPAEAQSYYWWLHPKLGMVKVDRNTNAMLVDRRTQQANTSATRSSN